MSIAIQKFKQISFFVCGLIIYCGLASLAPKLPLSQFIAPTIQAASLDSIPAGKIVYFGGRRFVKISAADSGVNYLWQASAEQQRPWHRTTSYSNTATDFYSRSTKLGYWLENTYLNSLSIAQPSAASWIDSHSWTMGNELDESTANINGKINLPGYSEWIANKDTYCLSLYGLVCNNSTRLGGSYTWLRTLSSEWSVWAWSIRSDGIPSVRAIYASESVVPALYLNSNVQVCGAGNGSYNSPYFLGEGDCTTFNQPTVPTANTISAFAAGTVIQMDNYKFIKMADYLEPQRLDLNGSVSNSYFVMADVESYRPWNMTGLNGCIGGSSNGACSTEGGWASNGTGSKAYLNETFYNYSLSSNMKDIIIDTDWPVGAVGDYLSENDEFSRIETSKIALISNSEWL